MNQSNLERTLQEYLRQNASRLNTEQSAIHPYYEVVAKLLITHANDASVQLRLSQSTDVNAIRSLLFADILREFASKKSATYIANSLGKTTSRELLEQVIQIDQRPFVQKKKRGAFLKGLLVGTMCTATYIAAMLHHDEDFILQMNPFRKERLADESAQTRASYYAAQHYTYEQAGFSQKSQNPLELYQVSLDLAKNPKSKELIQKSILEYSKTRKE